MRKVPITDIINSWLKADTRLEDQCREEICDYQSNSAYKGYILGFQDGVQSQTDEDASKCIISKQDIAEAFKDISVEVSMNEEDWKHICSSDQYWFYCGAMWILKQLEK
jgi:hypothetical protein